MSECAIILPPQIRCATHTLSLVSTTDAKKAIKDNPTLSRLNHSPMAKCSALWNASCRPKYAELLNAKLHDLQALNLQYCSHILQATIAGFEKRFNSFFTAEE